jgi:hypothetical protein
MDDRLQAVGATAKLVLAKVVRDFAGSRIEKQIVAQAVDIAWQVAVSRRGNASAVVGVGREGVPSGVLAALLEGAHA